MRLAHLFYYLPYLHYILTKSLFLYIKNNLSINTQGSLKKGHDTVESLILQVVPFIYLQNFSTYLRTFSFTFSYVINYSVVEYYVIVCSSVVYSVYLRLFTVSAANKKFDTVLHPREKTE